MRQNKLLKNAAKNTFLYLKHNSATVLTCVGAVGVVATSVMTAKATIKAVEIVNEAECKKNDTLTKTEIIKATAVCYVPAFIMGVSTLTCIFGANVLNKRQQAALISAYTLIDNSYKEYKNKLKELYGEEAHNNIVDSLMVEKAQQIDIYAQGIFSSSNLAIEDGTSEPRLFYDEYSGRYFESTIERVMNAEYHLNRNYILGGSVPLNMLYEFLGLETTDYGDAVGWSCYNEIYWIDFNHRKTVLDDGLECYILETPFGPTADYLDEE